MGMITMPQMKQARNIQLGAIYVLKGTYEKVRLLNIWPCEGVWVESANGEYHYDDNGNIKIVPFKHLLNANDAEVKSFLEAVKAC